MLMFRNKTRNGSHNTLIKQGLFDQRTVPMACIYICPGLHMSAILFLNFVFLIFESVTLYRDFNTFQSPAPRNLS